MKHVVLFLALLAVVAFVPSANAALTINYQINGGAVQTCGTGGDDGPVTCNFAGSGVNFAIVSSSSNSPGTPGGAEQFGSTLEVTSTTTATVLVWFTAQDFTQPTAPPGQGFEGSLSTTATSLNSVSSASLTSCVDNTNGTAPALGCSGGTVSNAKQTDTGAGATSSSNTVAANAVATYSLEQQLTINLSAGSDFNVITSDSLAVPEPASVLLLGTLLLGVGTVLRKRAARS